MAVTRTVKMLPSVFQSDANKKFLNATLDQLLTEPQLERINGYIGRKFAPTFKANDSYIREVSADRTNYQLEPAVIVKNKDSGEVEFHATYAEVIQKLQFYGVKTTDYSKLWENEYYSFNPRIDNDKFINFGQYYWLPNGPTVVDVYAGSIALENTYVVSPDYKNNVYNFSETFLSGNPDIVLARGGTYEFKVNQLGHDFWIQTDPGVSGTIINKSNLSAREVLGVDNNGTDNGTVTFAVPTKDAQDFYIQMAKVQDIDIVSDLSYSQIQNTLLSKIVDTYGGIDGQTTALNGKYIIFGGPYIDDVYWQGSSRYGSIAYDNETYDEGLLVEESKRLGIWQIVTTPTDNSDFVVNLNYVQSIPTNNKVSVKSGLVNGGTEWYMNVLGKLTVVPLITANLDILYYQDSVNPDLVGIIRLVEPGNHTIDVEKDILAKDSYISPNGVVFTNGLKVKFDASAVPSTYVDVEYYVEGVGTKIKLIPVQDLAVAESEVSIENPDYITINRASRDNSPWSRHNRWFHKDVITLSARYNQEVAIFDQDKLAKRPVIEFEPDLQLYNFGHNKKTPVDIYDTTIENPFITVEGVNAIYVDGTLLTEGMRVIFANDADPRTRDKIWVVNFANQDSDTPEELYLTLASDGDIAEGDTVTVKRGIYNNGKTFWYNGSEWAEGQAKTSINQAPLFDVFDSDGYSFSNPSRYPTVGSLGFAGNKIFSYSPGTGTKDSVLGFALAYKNFNQVGDIKFDNNFDSESFGYTINNVTYTVNVNSGFLKKYSADGSANYVNTWETIDRPSTQYQNISYIYDGFTNNFYVDVQPKTETDIPNLIVYVNSKKLTSRQWRKINVTGGGFRLYVATNFINKDDRIDILINSDQTSTLGFYQVPANLDLNSQNQNFESLTLGQMRNHIVALANNDLDFVGKIPGVSNLRDIPVKSNIGTIFQHSAPATYSALFLANDQTNLVDSVHLASQEYTRFKNKLLELAVNDPTYDFTDIPGTLDKIIKKINAVKNKSFPWYYSDMVPYNDQRNTITYNVFNPAVNRYEITEIFDDRVLSNRAIIVYLNGTQLIKGQDYAFSYTSPAIEFSTALALNDVIQIVEYANTDGSWIPETPTKLGLYPKFTPEIYLDESYITPRNMIRGHDGSLTVAFGDARDSLLLELEKRIYNNIKVSYNPKDFNLYDVLPGKFRNTMSNTEFNLLLVSSFMRWAGSNRLDYSTNSYSSADNDLTWNYRESPDVVDGELLPGTWRACYQYFFDTQFPSTRPWEMLGFSEQPDWWESFYGPAPYTKGNTILWDDLEAGYIAAGDRKGYDSNFVRPGLSELIPVDEHGALIPPYGLLSNAVSVNRVQLSFVFGNYGPVESAWRNSSEYPYALQIALALAKPGNYFGLNINKQTYNYNTVTGQYLVDATNQRITPNDVVIHGSIDADGNINRSVGYLNWIGDYMRTLGVDPAVVLDHYVKDHTVQLSYRMAGFSDKKYLKVYAEQHSPNSVNDSIIIPDSDYDLILNKSTPVQKIVYSAVIIERSSNGFKVSGYDTTRPHFVVVPPETTSKSYDLSILNETAKIYSGYKPFKVTVPYGYEFTTVQQVANFLIGYGLALTASGFKFDNFDQDLGEIRNWALSVKEFLFWTKQKWNPGSVIVLTPAGNELVVNARNAVVDKIDNSFFGSKVVNQNFETLTTDAYSISRVGNAFSVKADMGQTICLADLNVVQFEHALIFNNTTMFSDTVYQPELGSRQYRLKLAGFKTGNWTGNLDPQGFIYNSTSVANWQSNKDYLKGDLIQYKGLYYVAIENIAGATDFNFAQWKQVDKDSIKTGLLNNFATNSKISEQFYDVDGVNLESQFDLFGKGLIGYRNRSYLNDLDLDDTSQVKFYQGFIKSKGTPNSFDALLGLSNNNIQGDITFSEDWAFRVGEYGALETNRFVEALLSESSTLTNPFTVQFTTDENSLADLPVAEPYKFSAEVFGNNIFLNRDTTSKHITDLGTAGFVHFDDVDYTIFDLADYATLNSDIGNIGSGTLIWTAKDFDSNWNVYRVSETQIQATDVLPSLDNIVTFKTNNPHGLSIDDVVLVKSADKFSGFYRIVSVPNLTRFNVEYTGSLSGFYGLSELSAQVMYLHSVKFNYASDIGTYLPRDGWRTNETAWVENDSNGWAVYSKSAPWSGSVELTPGETVLNGLYGESVAIGRDNNFAVVGQPGIDDGRLISYVRGFDNRLVEDATIVPNANNTSELGKSIGQGRDYTAAGAPGSASEQGYVYVTKRLANGNLVVQQVLTGPDSAAGDLYGSAVAVSADDQWLYVSAVNADKVYVYGLQHDTVTKLYNFTANGTDDTFTLGFVPDSIDSVVISDDTTIYVPHIDYTISGNQLEFTSAPAAGDYAVQQFVGYRYVTTIAGDTGTNFGYSLATTTDGAQVIIGAPLATVDGHESAGAVHVYDRTVESFISIGQTVFNAIRTTKTVGKVKVNGQTQSRSNTSTTDPAYEVKSDARIIQFFDAVDASAIVTIETNDFNLLATYTASIPSTNSQFGYSVDVCGNNCSVYVGSPYYDGVQYNTGAVYRLVNQGRVYGTITGTVLNPTVASGDSIRINDFEVVFLETTLSSVVTAINDENIPGVSAVNENGYLKLTSDSVIATNKIRILPGSGSAIESLGLEVFAETQIISHPIAKADENFGQRVKVDATGTILLVGSTVATTYEKTLFDSGETIVDHSIDSFVDPMANTGSVYVLNLLRDNRSTIDYSGVFVYTQQLDPTSTLSAAGQFGYDFDILDGEILVGAPADNKLVSSGGRVYQFRNTTGDNGWDKIREQAAKVDIDSILKIYLYNKNTNTIVDVLDYIDPAKGKILGSAEQEINYRTEFDPAAYNSGEDTASIIVNTKSHWTNKQLGQVWWDLSTVKFVDYEQDSIIYKSANWGRVFPGSSIDVYEWVSSDVLPSQYASAGNEGTPKYIDDSAYVQTQYVDSESGATKVKYYFWVKDRTSVEFNKEVRKLPTSLITQLIENPKSQDVKFAAAIQSDSIALYNIDSDLRSDSIVLHIDYATAFNDSTIHSEWALVGEGSTDKDFLPDRIYNKIIDSLAGIDSIGNPVPDPMLPVQQRYGIGIRPRQSIFVDRSSANKVVVEFLNKIFKELLLRQTSTLTSLYDEEAIPPEGSGAYDLAVDSYETLTYINILVQPVGYKVLVENNTQIGGLWTIYTKLADNTWFLSRVQSYKVSDHWQFVDWFATGFDESVVPKFVVAQQADLSTLTLTAGDIVKIQNDGTGNWKLVRITPYLVETVGVQNGTIQIKSTLWDQGSINDITGWGYDNDTFDTLRFDQNPNIEIRSLVTSIIDNILINELSSEVINLIFAIMNYVLNEQKYIDWAFKTSFVSVLHKIRKLTQPSVFIKDNQNYYEQYIEEVKPYRTTVREYVLDYTGVDNVNGYVTDFDLPAYYDTVLQTYRSPSGEYLQDQAAMQSAVYKDWANHYSYQVSSIEVTNRGSGYTIAPIVTVTGSTTNNNATGRALVSGGRVTQIILDNPGTGYITTPVVTLAGGNGTGAKAYAHLTNGLVRGITTTLTFDRLTYSTQILSWSANTAYVEGDRIAYNGVVYDVDQTFVSSATFDGNNLTEIDPADLTTANDRIKGYYVPTPNQPGLDFAQLQSGVDYPGVQILGPLFSYNPAFDSSMFDSTIFDSFEIGPDGTIQLSSSILDTIIQSQYADSVLGTRPEDINIDGGAFVDTYSSHAPEELIPGIVFDTLDLQVYQRVTPDANQEYQSFDIQFTAFDVESNTEFVYKATHSNNTLFVYSYLTGNLVEGDDFEVNYHTRTITVTTPLIPEDKLFVYAYNCVGQNKLNDVEYEVVGTSGIVNCSMPYDLIGTQLVFVNGVKTENFVLVDSTPTATIQFLSPIPAEGDFVHITNYGWGGTTDPVVAQAYPTFANRDRFTVTSAAPTYPTDYTFELTREIVGGSLYDAHAIVKLNGRRLRPATTIYYTGDGSEDTFAGPETAADINAATILNTDYVVHVDDELQVLGTDYTFPFPSATGPQDLTFTTPPAPDTIITISITKFREFVLTSDTLIINSSILLDQNDKVEVVSFSNSSVLGVKTNTYVGNQATTSTVIVGLDTVPFDSIEFDNNISVTLVKPEFILAAAITNPVYAWVTLNGKRLTPNFDFVIQWDTLFLADTYPLNDSDVLVVTTISTESLSQPLGYRIFKNMVGETEYLRISKSHTTVLASNLSMTATEVQVDDASALPIPNPELAIPGVVFINGERITYYEIDTNTNTLSQLRRGTGGTGATDHYVGSRVVDSSIVQRIPLSSNYSFTPNANVIVTTSDSIGNVPAQTYTLQANLEYTRANVWYTQGANTATNGESLSSTSTVQANFLKESESFLP